MNCSCTEPNANASGYGTGYRNFLTDFFIAQVTLNPPSLTHRELALKCPGDGFIGLGTQRMRRNVCSPYHCNRLTSREFQEITGRGDCLCKCEKERFQL